MTITKQTTFECDRCGKEEFETQVVTDPDTYPSAWEMREIQGQSYDLCPTCCTTFETLKEEVLAHYRNELELFVQNK